MNVIALIQARAGSTRFPGKVLTDLCGRPLLAHVIERAKAIPGVDEVAVAGPLLSDNGCHGGEGDSPEGKAIETVCREARIAHYRAARESDVLERLWRVAEAVGADVVMRLTGDNPLIAPEVCQHVLETWWTHMATRRAGQFVYANNLEPKSGYPWGLDTQVFDRGLLSLAAREVTAAEDREHVCPWMARQPRERVRTVLVQDPHSRARPPGFAKLKLSMDTPEDLERVRLIMAKLPEGPEGFSLLATVKAAAESGLLGAAERLR